MLWNNRRGSVEVVDPLLAVTDTADTPGRAEESEMVEFQVISTRCLRDGSLWFLLNQMNNGPEQHQTLAQCTQKESPGEVGSRRTKILEFTRRKQRATFSKRYYYRILVN